MSDPTTPDTTTPTPDLPPTNKKSLAKLFWVILGPLALTILIISILLPTLGNLGRGAPEMKNSTQVRGIVQGLVTYAGGNKERMPGNSSKGYLIQDVDGKNEHFMPATKHGGTVEGRFWLMLDANNFSGDYIISPSETKTVWTTGEISSDNYSYAMLNIHSSGNPLADNRVRPDQTSRAREWKQSISTQAVLVTDRARIPGGHIGNHYDKIYSVHTHEADKYWAGSIGRGDGSASFEHEDTLDTQYGDGPEIEADRLFAKEQDSHKRIDTLTDPNATWDDTANALLGYTSVGYQDPDIASD